MSIRCCNSYGDMPDPASRVAWACLVEDDGVAQITIGAAAKAMMRLTPASLFRMWTSTFFEEANLTRSQTGRIIRSNDMRLKSRLVTNLLNARLFL